jgi:heme-degrading monooxygenase HmoA
VAFASLSRFAVANGRVEDVKQAFRDRPHSVDSAPGFLRLEVLNPIDTPEEIWLLTFWSDEASFRAWHHSHLYREAHQGIPKGVKLVPKSVEIRYFEHVCS